LRTKKVSKFKGQDKIESNIGIKQEILIRHWWIKLWRTWIWWDRKL